MDNKYVLMAMAGVMGFIWYFVGHLPYFGDNGSFNEDYLWGALLAVGLGAGSTGGKDIFSILIEGVTGYIGTMIKLAVFGVVGGSIYLLLISEVGFDPMVLINIAVIFVVSGLLFNLTLSYMRKAD